MNPRYLLRLALAVLDLGALLLSAWLGWLVRFELLPGWLPSMVHVMQPMNTMSGFLVLCALAQLFFAANSGLYQFKTNIYRQQFFGSLRTVALVFLVVVAYLIVFQLNFQFSRLATLLMMGILAVVMPLGRLLLLRIVVEAGVLRIPALLIGSSGALQSFAATMEDRHFERQTRVLHRLQPEELMDPATFLLRPQSEERIQRLITEEGLGKVLILMEGLPRRMLVALLREFEIRLKYIQLVPDAPSLALVGSRVLNTDNALMLGLHQNLMRPAARFSKRLVDNLLVLPFLPLLALLLILCLPLFRGRPLRRIERFDMEGRPFQLWQLAVDYESGGFLFQSGLYKLPEILGILTGRQALVGPAPLIERELGEYASMSPALRRIRPGMTGLWQISDFGYFDYDHRMALDLYYAMNWTPLLDLRILGESAWKGIYSLFRPRKGAMRA